MKNDFFDNSIRQKLGGHEAPVPGDAWENIQKGKRRRRPLPFFWIFAGLLLCGGAGFFLYRNSIADKTVMAEKRSLKQQEESNAVKAVVENSNENGAATGEMPGEKNTMQLSQQKKKDKKENDIIKNSKTNNDRNKPAVQLLLQNDDRVVVFNKKKRTGSVVKNNSVISNSIATEDGKATAKKKRHANDAKLAMTITAPQTEENNLPVGEETTNDHLAGNDSLPLFIKEDIAVPVEKMKADTAKKIATTQTKTPTPPETKKKRKTGFDIDMSLSGFIPVQNQQKIVSISRTMETPLHKAEFTADKIRSRLQSSLGFNLMLFKNLSSKTAAGAGFSYNVIKEYIDLSGEEVNTMQRVVQRLHNGSSLVSDTVTTVTRGTRNINAVNSYTFLSIPVSIRYQVLQRNKWTIDLHAGVDINLQSKYKNSIGGILVPQFSGINNTKRNQSIGTGFHAGIRLSRRINKNYLIYAAPYFQVNPKKLYLKEMLSPAGIQRAGISLGISYRL